MRETCLFCVSKHIGQAIVLMTEVPLGYPEHLFVAIGHLAEAETESVSQYPEFAQKIRKVRTALMGQEGDFKHDSLMKLLKEARQIAEGVNGMDEIERIDRMLYPKKYVTLSNKID